MTAKPMLDMTPAARQRREAEIETRLAGLDLPAGAARNAARKRLVEEIEREEMAQAQAAQDRSEASAERTRILSIWKAGLDRDRGVQVFRMALSAPISVRAVEALLPGLPRDAEADPASLVMPASTAFGSDAARQERGRIRAIMALPEAQGRMAAAAALALEGDGDLTAAMVAPLLAQLPIEAPKMSGAEQLAARWDANGPSFGPSDASVQSKGEAVREGWKRAAAAANASIGAVDPVPTAGNPGLDPALAAARAGVRP